jgi:hypothetical protein
MSKAIGEQRLVNSTVTRKIARIVGATGLVVGASFTPYALAGSGRALDQDTNEPIAGVRMTLYCSRPSGIESEVLIRKVTRITDDAGLYSFSTSDRFGCMITRISGEKEGYQPNRSNVVSDYLGRTIPTIEYFVSNSSWLSLELQRITHELALTPGATALQTYETWFTALDKAKRVAAKPNEISFVREHYCPPLVTAYASVTAIDKEKMARILVRQYLDENGQSHEVRKSMYEVEVEPVCG